MVERQQLFLEIFLLTLKTIAAIGKPMKTKRKPTASQIKQAAKMLAAHAPVAFIARELGISYWYVYKLKLAAR